VHLNIFCLVCINLHTHLLSICWKDVNISLKAYGFCCCFKTRRAKMISNCKAALSNIYCANWCAWAVDLWTMSRSVALFVPCCRKTTGWLNAGNVATWRTWLSCTTRRQSGMKVGHYFCYFGKLTAQLETQQQQASPATCDRDIFRNCVTLTLTFLPHFLSMAVGYQL